MSEKNPSQAQQSTQTQTQSSEPPNRMETFFRELAKLEERNVEATNRAIEESSRLWKESVAYGVRLSNEWRVLALKTTRQAAEMISSSFPS